MTELVVTMLAAAGLGLLGAGHCFGMCGGVVAALSFAVPKENSMPLWRLHLGYNLGRVTSYGLIGGAAAALSGQLPALGLPVARTLAGLLLIAMGLHMAGWWRGILWLERGGRHVWRWLKPVGDRFMPLRSFPRAFGIGLIWGWLPCGLVYAALGYAAVQGNFSKGALVMLAFGLGTMPALLAGGFLANTLKALFLNRQVRHVLAAGYLIFGAWVLVAAWYHGSHSHTSDAADPAHHHHHH